VFNIFVKSERSRKLAIPSWKREDNIKLNVNYVRLVVEGSRSSLG